MMNNVSRMRDFILQQGGAEVASQFARYYFETVGPLSIRGKLCQAIQERLSADLARPELTYTGNECHAIGDAAQARGDSALALEWYRKGAGRGHANCKNSVGVCFLFGRGIKSDNRQAGEWFLDAVKYGASGKVMAQNLFVAAYYLSHGQQPEPDDLAMARACLEAAIRISKRKQAAEARDLLASLPPPDPASEPHAGAEPLESAAPVLLQVA